MAETVKIEGLADLENALAELPKATARNTLRRTLKKAGEKVKAAWQPNLPVLTGKLERSLIVGPSSKLTPRQKRDAKQEGKYFAEMHVGTSDPAGQFGEFGTFKQIAHPAGRPAWEGTKEAALEGIGQDLGEEITKAAGRLARKAARLAAAGES